MADQSSTGAKMLAATMVTHLFDRSPLKNISWFSVTISEFNDSRKRAILNPSEREKGFTRGYVRLKNDLYFFKDKDAIGLKLELTAEQLKAYDKLVESGSEPTLISAESLQDIHQLLGYVPEEKYFEQPSLKAYIQSLGLLETAPIHVLTFKVKPLLKTNPALLKYMSSEERASLAEELRLAFYQLCAQYQAEDIIHQRQHLNTYIADIERCASLLRHLELVEKEERLEAQQHHAQQTEESLKTWYREKIKLIEAFRLDFSTGKTVYLTRWMSELNVWRSYWGWAGLTMRVALSMMPKDFYNVQETIDVTTDPQESLRLLACILYYTRFLINFMLVLKHTFKGPWMSQEEKRLIEDHGGTWNRFKERLAAEKFALINDMVWATNNLLNLLWLAKPGLGPVGDLLALFLLIGDVYLTKWANAEAEKKHQQDLQYYDDEIKRLNKKIRGDDTEETRARIAMADDEAFRAAKAQLARLERARDQYIDHWQRQSKERTADLLYAAGIGVGFAVMIVPWAEVGAQASAEALMLGSAAFCFALALVYSGYKAYMAVTKARDSRLSALEECYQILSADEPLSEADYIRFQDLQAQATYHEAMARHQLYVFMRSVIIQSIIPIAIFAGFTFSTFGIGVAAFAVVVAASILTHYALEYFKPEEAALAEFDQDKYNAFSKENEKKSIKADIEMMRTQGVVGLFSSRPEPEFKPDTATPEAGLGS